MAEPGRITSDSSSVESSKPGEDRKTGREDDCRCKEVSEMKPGELFRLMINDLAFWKKPKKE